MNTLKVLKLITGEEILGLVKDDKAYSELNLFCASDNVVFVSNPLKIQSTYDHDSKNYSIYLCDWIPAIESTIFPIEKQKILTVGSPSRELEHRYYEIILVSGTVTTDEELEDHEFDDDDVQ